MRDVLDGLLAYVFIEKREFVLDLVVDCARNADAARLGETFQPRSDIDPVAVNLFALDHHIAEIDADAKLHPARWRHLSVLGLECSLDRHGAMNCVDYAGE